jgi:hypothetical protein
MLTIKDQELSYGQGTRAKLTDLKCAEESKSWFIYMSRDEESNSI